jgi:hypothetical protein
MKGVSGEPVLVWKRENTPKMYYKHAFGLLDCKINIGLVGVLIKLLRTDEWDSSYK